GMVLGTVLGITGLAVAVGLRNLGKSCSAPTTSTERQARDSNPTTIHVRLRAGFADGAGSIRGCDFGDGSNAVCSCGFEDGAGSIRGCDFRGGSIAVCCCGFEDGAGSIRGCDFRGGSIAVCSCGFADGTCSLRGSDFGGGSICTCGLGKGSGFVGGGISIGKGVRG